MGPIFGKITHINISGLYINLKYCHLKYQRNEENRYFCILKEKRNLETIIDLMIYTRVLGDRKKFQVKVAPKVWCFYWLRSFM
jgi:hypothetical protein